MAGLSYRGLQRSVAALACLVSAAGVLSGSPTAPTVTTEALRVLQMNLCNSGLAGCYTGQSVTRAGAAIRQDEPDVVTLNEVCQGDVETLGHLLGRVHRSDRVVRLFKAAPDRRTGSATRCLDGQPYGIGLLAHIPEPHRGYATRSGVYPVQDTRDPEVRAWLCIRATAHFQACVTHLANTDQAVALAQCGHLLDTAIPAIRGRGRYEPTVVGGDLNLTYRGSPGVRSCLPAGYRRADDGAVQHVVATRDFTVSSSRLIGMDGSTDHPSLLVSFTIRAETGGRCNAEPVRCPIRN
jgi:endonuclease/exonuclease/phosphatase family metal-dependent hydrolase